MLNKYYGIKKAHLVNIVKNGRCHSLKVTARPSSVPCGWPTNQPRHSSGATILGSYQRLSKRREAGQSWTSQGMYHVNCLHLACILVNVSNIWFLREKISWSLGCWRKTNVMRLSGKDPLTVLGRAEEPARTAPLSAGEPQPGPGSRGFQRSYSHTPARQSPTSRAETEETQITCTQTCTS